MRWWMGLGAAALVGAVLRVWWLGQTSVAPESDAAGYHAFALSLAAGQGYNQHGHPSAWWVPGYPAWLAVLYGVFGPSVAVAQAGNVALGAAAVVLTGALGLRVFSPVAGLLGAALVATFPSLVGMVPLLLSENLLVPGVLALALLTIHARGWRSGLVVGLLGGLLALVREQAAGLLLACVLFWLLGRGPMAWRRSAAGLGVAAVILGVWTARNIVELGVPSTSVTSANVLWISVGPEADGGNVVLPTERWGQEGTSGEGGLYRRAQAEALAALDPWRVVAQAPARFRLLLGSDAWPFEWLGATGHPLALLASPAWGLVLLVGLIGAVGASRVPQAPSRLLVVLLLAGFLPHFVVYGASRLHAPLVPLLALLAAGTIQALATWARREHRFPLLHGYSHSPNGRMRRSLSITSSR